MVELLCTKSPHSASETGGCRFYRNVLKVSRFRFWIFIFIFLPFLVVELIQFSQPQELCGFSQLASYNLTQD